MSDSVVVALGCVVVSIVVCDVDAVETSYIISAKFDKNFHYKTCVNMP